MAYEENFASSISSARIRYGLLQAGEPVAYKQLTPRPPVFWDTGFYGATDMGANVYQNRGGDRTNESRDLGQHLVGTGVRFHF